jgi:N-hydroxyarylamine O-acetyltransferase
VILLCLLQPTDCVGCAVFFEPMHLASYLQRIRLPEASGATLATLNRIVSHHTASIPFENLQVLLEQRIDLTPEAIHDKLVTRGRGGYCFEQNQLLQLALEALHFKVTCLSARVRWLLPREVTPPRTHLFLRVDMADGPWIADVGVGGTSPTRALRLIENLEQETPHDFRRFIRFNDRWLHQVRFTQSSDWLDICEFTGEPMPEIDRTVANWWTSTHPDSKFHRNLIVSLAALDGSRWNLHNTELTLHKPGQEPERQLIQSHHQLAEILANTFHLPLAPQDRFPILNLPEGEPGLRPEN